MPDGERADLKAPLSAAEMQERFPQFEILEWLGRGGMGVVYKARQKTLDRLVAIKVLADGHQGEVDFAQRFEREAKVLAQMNHTSIVTIHDFGEADGLYYIVMEYVDGVNLRDLLHEGKLAPEQALAIVPPICEALEYAHDKGVVHRDIKPENLLLDCEGRVKIADFGIASLVGATGEKSGTPPYMAPEQEQGVVDRRADIYALGVVLYEMLTGERPAKELVAPSKRVEVDVRLDEVVLRALEKDPARRYQTAGEFRTVVETLGGSGASGVADADVSKDPPKAETAVVKEPKAALRSIVFHAVAIQVAWLMLACGLQLLGNDLESVHLNPGHALCGIRQFLIGVSRDGWLVWSVVPALVLVGVSMSAVGRRTGRKGLWLASAICGLPVFVSGIVGLLGVKRYGGPPMALSLVAPLALLGTAWLTVGLVSLRHAASSAGKVALWALGLLLAVVLIVFLTLLASPVARVALLFSFFLSTLVGVGSLVCGLVARRTRLGRGVTLGWGAAALLTVCGFAIFLGITRYKADVEAGDLLAMALNSPRGAGSLPEVASLSPYVGEWEWFQGRGDDDFCIVILRDDKTAAVMEDGESGVEGRWVLTEEGMTLTVGGDTVPGHFDAQGGLVLGKEKDAPRFTRKGRSKDANASPAEGS